jgi:hypothetical protein
MVRQSAPLVVDTHEREVVRGAAGRVGERPLQLSGARAAAAVLRNDPGGPAQHQNESKLRARADVCNKVQNFITMSPRLGRGQGQQRMREQLLQSATRR